MKLELASFPVTNVRLDGRTGYDDGVLEINKEELVSLVLQDERIVSADIDVAHPGEQTRIVYVRDAVEPRIKVSGPGCVFPGVLGPLETVGEGRTNTLSGVTVMHSARYEPTVLTGTGAQASGVVDMWGPGARFTPLSSTINIVLLTELATGINELEAHTAIQMAEFKVARRLAETTKNASPESVETFELSRVDPSLPRVVYVMGFITEWHTPVGRILFYGFPIKESLPSLVHPTEFLDGALTTDTRKGTARDMTTARLMNHPVVLALLREHGKRLNFLGVILQRTRFESEFGKQLTAATTSQMARLLGADNAIITRTTPSGNNLMDAMLTVQACEKKGIKTVFLTPEAGAADGRGPALHFYVPEATAMVSTGNLNTAPLMPAPTKVIGCARGETVIVNPGAIPISPWSEVQIDAVTDLCDGVDWFGALDCRSAIY
ncbi:MAG: hypothetical protein HY675_09200 [Chloroflexi bacterium]|nr:hypothetical protein [Chloroflexota bacterium]